MTTLPPELDRIVHSYLEYPDLMRFGATSKYARSLVDKPVNKPIREQSWRNWVRRLIKDAIFENSEMDYWEAQDIWFDGADEGFELDSSTLFSLAYDAGVKNKRCTIFDPLAVNLPDDLQTELYEKVKDKRWVPSL